MKPSEVKKKIAEIEARQHIANFESNLSRARSITVGTAFGGTTEVSMRSEGGQSLWCLMQPVEVTELIHQLAANIGCHIAIKPRDDFSSWREWRVSEAEKKHLNGHAPFPNDMSVFQQLGASNFDQAAAENLVNAELAPKEYEYVNGGAQKPQKKRGVKNGNTVAIEKTVNGRNTKRTPKAS
jgi:hypothetical protein